jgi:hypothetical protein
MKGKKTMILIMVIFSIIMIYVNLRGQKIEVKTEGRITVVYNPQNPVESLDSSIDMILKQNLIIGTDEKNTDYYFEAISDIKSDGNGNIYIVDEQAHCINVFNKNGNYIKNIGRKGRGPGEFIAPTEMAILEGKIIVYSLGRISYFDLEGHFITMKKAMFGRIVCFDSKGNIIAQQPSHPGKDMKLFLRKFNLESQILYTVASLAMEGPKSPEEKREAFPETILYTIRKDDSIVWANRNKYELNLVDDRGHIFLKIKKKFNPVPLTEEHKKTFLAYVDGTEDQYNFPKYLPPIRYVFADDKNRIFVNTYKKERDDKYIYDIFDSKGRYVEKIAIKGLPMFCRNGYLYCRAEDKNNFHQVIRYLTEIE